MNDKLMTTGKQKQIQNKVRTKVNWSTSQTRTNSPSPTKPQPRVHRQVEWNNGADLQPRAKTCQLILDSPSRRPQLPVLLYNRTLDSLDCLSFCWVHSLYRNVLLVFSMVSLHLEVGLSIVVFDFGIPWQHRTYRASILAPRWAQNCQEAS